MNDASTTVQAIDFKAPTSGTRLYEVMAASGIDSDLGSAKQARFDPTNKADTFELLSGKVGKEIETLKVTSKDFEKSQAVTTAAVSNDTSTVGAVQSMVRSTEAMAKIAKFQNQFGVLHGSVAATMGSIKQLLKG
jgi:hypothetical protein